MPDDLSQVRKTVKPTPAEVVDLWPDGQAERDGMAPEVSFRWSGGVADGSTMIRNVSVPTLSVFRPDPGAANGAGVMIFPGGGWKVLFWENEGLQVADWFVQRGYTAFLLKYRLTTTPEDPATFDAMVAKLQQATAERLSAAAAPTALDQLTDDATRKARQTSSEDGRRALQIVRERSAEFGLDPDRVGVIGFSAGAALAVDITMTPQGPAPAFVAAIYGGETRGRPVPQDAPPLFTIVALDDRLHFHVVEQLYLDWSGADRSAELHVFARGGHSFGMIRQGLPSDRWIDLLGDWLTDQGFG